MFSRRKSIYAIKNMTQLHGAHILFAIYALVTVINLIFFYTYPINAAASDNPNYLVMMHDRASNLINASGYPAFMMILLQLFHILPGTTINDLAWLDSIQFLQFLTHISLLFICVFLCAKIFNKVTASILCLTWGINTLFMAGANSAAPEWFQGELLLLALLTSTYAFVICSRNKLTRYALSWLIFTMAYLVKPNSLVFAPTLIAIIFFESKKISWKFTAIIVAIVPFYIVTNCYIEIFHYRSTQSRQLSYDHAWVLTYAMPEGYFSLPPEKLSINSLRWRALSAIVPPDYGNASAYRTLDTGAPLEIRNKYLTKYHEIMGLSKDGLIAFVNTHPLTSTFKKEASAVPLYWYIGLPETDALGIAAFKESVLLLPQAYLKKILQRFAVYLFHEQSDPQTRQMVPFESRTLGLNLQDSKTNNFFVRATVPNKLTNTDMVYWSPEERIWKPGMQFFQILHYKIMRQSPVLFVFLIACIGIFWTNQTKIRLLGLSYLLSLLFFYTASFTLSGMRNKEVITILPTLALFFSLGLVSFFKLAINYSFRYYWKGHGTQEPEEYLLIGFT